MPNPRARRPRCIADMHKCVSRTGSRGGGHVLRYAVMLGLVLLVGCAHEEPNAAEQVLDFTPGTPYTLTVGMTAPLDVVLGPGEQVRNIVGGDRTPAESHKTLRW